MILFLACLLTAFGPSAVVLYFYISTQPRLLLLSLTSAFYYVVSLLLISLIPKFISISPLILSISASFLLEISRISLYHVFLLMDPVLIKIAQLKKEDSPITDLSHYFAVGYGWGLISALVHFISPLVQTLQGNGVLMSRSCPDVDIYFLSAVMTLLFSGLNVLWTVAMFSGLQKRSYLQVGLVFVSHILSSCSVFYFII